MTSGFREDTSDSTRAGVPREYLPLHKYLAARFADIVVLRIGEMEDLLGWKLPALARVQADWWLNPQGNGTASVQSRAWSQAGRKATVNLSAMKVTFERVRS